MYVLRRINTYIWIKGIFMTTKLTLSVKKETIEKAKRYSAKHGKSISKMVEEYLDGLLEKPEKSLVQQMNELMAPHRDRINKSLPKGKSYKEMVGDWRYEDYLEQTGKKSTRKKTASK